METTGRLAKWVSVERWTRAAAEVTGAERETGKSCARRGWESRKADEHRIWDEQHEGECEYEHGRI